MTTRIEATTVEIVTAKFCIVVVTDHIAALQQPMQRLQKPASTLSILPRQLLKTAEAFFHLRIENTMIF